MMDTQTQEIQEILAITENYERLTQLGFDEFCIESLAKDGAKPELLEAICQSQNWIGRLDLDIGVLFSFMSEGKSAEHIHFVDQHADKILTTLGLARKGFLFEPLNYNLFTKQTHGDFTKNGGIEELFLGIVLKGELSSLQAMVPEYEFSKKFIEPTESHRTRLEAHESMQYRLGRR